MTLFISNYVYVRAKKLYLTRKSSALLLKCLFKTTTLSKIIYKIQILFCVSRTSIFLSFIGLKENNLTLALKILIEWFKVEIKIFLQKWIRGKKKWKLFLAFLPDMN